MNRYKVDKELKKYIRRILIRGFHEFKIVLDENEEPWCEINVSERTFQRIVERAQCEKKTREEKEFDRFYVTANEYLHLTFMSELEILTGRKYFDVIDPENLEGMEEVMYL